MTPTDATYPVPTPWDEFLFCGSQEGDIRHSPFPNFPDPDELRAFASSLLSIGGREGSLTLIHAPFSPPVFLLEWWEIGLSRRRRSTFRSEGNPSEGLEKVVKVLSFRISFDARPKAEKAYFSSRPRVVFCASSPPQEGNLFSARFRLLHNGAPARTICANALWWSCPVWQEQKQQTTNKPKSRGFWQAG